MQIKVELVASVPRTKPEQPQESVACIQDTPASRSIALRLLAWVARMSPQEILWGPGAGEERELPQSRVHEE